MNIYKLNKLTKKNILFYNTENKSDIFHNLLIDDHFDDAIILFNIYKWKTIKTTHKRFLQYLLEHNIKCKISLNSFREICKKGDKELFLYGKKCMKKNMKKHMKKNIIYYCLMSNNYDFIQYVFKLHKISYISKNIFIECIKKTMDIRIINLLFKCLHIDINFTRDILYYIIKHKYYNLFSKNLISLYPKLILNQEFNSFFYISLSYNNIEMSYHMLHLQPNLIQHMNYYYMVNIFMNAAYESIYFINLLSPHILKNIDDNYIFLDLVCNPYFSSEKMVQYYLHNFNPILKKETYYKSFKTLCYHGKGNISKLIIPFIDMNLIDVNHFFLHGCLHNFEEIVDLFIDNIDEDVLKNSFMIVCNNGYLKLAKKLYNISFLYEAMYYICKNDNNNYSSDKMEIIQWLYIKNDTIYPRELIYYLCKYNHLLWIIKDSSFFIDELCIDILCLNGHFELFYYLYINNYFNRSYISNAFYSACQNSEGYFIAKWIYSHHYLSKQIIVKSFYNSNHVPTIKWLYYKERKYIHLRDNDNAYFKELCISKNYEAIRWICSIYNNYSYSIINGIIFYNIKLYKIKKSIIYNEDCSICYEKSNCKTLCNHYYCYKCIEQWYNKQNNCPMCRQSINEIFIQH